LLPTHLAETHASVKREANEDTVRRVISSLEDMADSSSVEILPALFVVATGASTESAGF
jgi:hypothetical protein